ncbi:hypothetical protein [Ignavibacterium sp.]|uniref:hypothetical protein n=1 Tax=Ignavibacterium sp. TaxID=2651167 RepID=UPI00307E5AD8
MQPLLKFLTILIFSSASILSQSGSNQLAELKAKMKSDGFSAFHNFTVVRTDNISSQHHSILNLAGQALVGSSLAVGFSIFPISAGFADAWSGDATVASQTALGVLAISTYLFGAAVGVHWIASYENPNLSFWGTFGYSAIGGGVGTIIASVLAANYTTVPAAGVFIVALTPIMGAMTYASFISDWPDENQKTSFNQVYDSHKDLIEHSNIVNLELLRVEL